MARYLTPSKVAFLALVSIYSEGVVANSATVELLSFFVLHLLPLDTLDSKDCVFHSDKVHTISIEEFEKATSCLASSIPGRTLWDIFLKKLWQLDCVDSLEEFFTAVSDLVTKPREEQIRDPETGKMRFSRMSPLGAFVRRAQLEYARLQFHDSVSLWRALIKYRMPTYQTWAKRNPIHSKNKVDANLLELGLDLNSPLANIVYGGLVDSNSDAKITLSTKDMERLLEFQVQEMQSKGTRVTEEMRKTLKWMLISGAAVPNLSHYVRFLDSWKAGDFPSSFDSLHQYFDYTVHNQDRTCYQYALLNLATLQADFGCLGEAVSAMQEAISIARETQDMHCLNYCVSWLYHCRKGYSCASEDVQSTGMLGSDREALSFLQAKARENNTWSLLSTSLLEEAKLELAYGESIASVFEHIAKAAHLNAGQSMNSAMGQLLVLQVAFFMRLGVSRLASATYEILQECYREGALFDDYLKVNFQNSLLLFLSGSHAQAISQLEGIPSSSGQSLKSQQTWVFLCGLLKLRQQLNRNDIMAAEHLVAQLHGCAPNEFEHLASLHLLEIEYMMCKSDYSSALRLVEQVAKSTQQGSFDVALQIQLLNLKARIFQNTDQPERAFSLAMRAASIAYRSRVLPSLWEALGHLSTVLMTFQEFNAAANILESVIPQILESNDCILAARTYSLLADANMGLAGGHKQDNMRQQEYLSRALEFTDCAFEEYSNAENVQGQCETTSKKATLMYLSGDFALANDYAARYLDLKRDARMQS
ncbi:APC5 protein [Ophidiomyces ophidiicola]|nr:APC5 protein [Ophidiomyces ophidiicola]